MKEGWSRLTSAQRGPVFGTRSSRLQYCKIHSFAKYRNDNWPAQCASIRVSAISKCRNSNVAKPRNHVHACMAAGTAVCMHNRSKMHKRSCTKKCNSHTYLISNQNPATGNILAMVEEGQIILDECAMSRFAWLVMAHLWVFSHDTDADGRPGGRSPPVGFIFHIKSCFSLPV